MSQPVCRCDDPMYYHCGELRQWWEEAKRERDKALRDVAVLRQALKNYYHECRCRHTEMDEVNRQAYAALRATDGPEDKP